MSKKFEGLLNNHKTYFAGGDINLKELLPERATLLQKLEGFASDDKSKYATDLRVKLERIEVQLEAVATTLHDAAPTVMATPSLAASVMNEVIQKGLNLQTLNHVMAIEMTLAGRAEAEDRARKHEEFMALQKQSTEQQRIALQQVAPVQVKKTNTNN